MSLQLVAPRIQPPLDENFRPAILANQNFQREVESVGVRLVLGLERSGGEFSRFETKVHPEGHPNFEANYQYIERIVKFLLWQRGGHTLYVGGSQKIADHLKKIYSKDGARSFDYKFMGEQVYEKDFSVIACDVDEVPASRETGKLLGRNLHGHRIGFDLGASDRKVSAVVDGNPIYSEEVVWEPRKNADPRLSLSRDHDRAKNCRKQNAASGCDWWKFCGHLY